MSSQSNLDCAVGQQLLIGVVLHQRLLFKIYRAILIPDILIFLQIRICTHASEYSRYVGKDYHT